MPFTVTDLAPSAPWTDVTGSDITNLSFQVQGGRVMLRAMPGATPPTASDVGFTYESLLGGTSVSSLAEIFPSAGAAPRLFAKSHPSNNGRVTVIASWS